MQKLKKIFNKINNKKKIFYIILTSGIATFFLSAIITRGQHFYNYFFIPSQNDHFMDFFNVLQSLYSGPYTLGFIYPPFPLLIYKMLLRFVPYEIAGETPGIIRATQSGEIVFLFYFLVTLLLFLGLIMEIKKGTRVEKYIFTFIILFSAPFLFQFERANIIFVALLFSIIFLFFKDSKNRIVREFAIISLAISGAIKIYPLLFGVLLVKEKRYRDVIKVFIYSLGFFLLPFLALGGISQLPILIKNLQSTSDETTKWGFGYMVNIQNMTRMIFASVGDFGTNPIIIGRALSFILLLVGIIASFLSHSRWKTIAILTLLTILVPHISYEYALIFMLIPLVMFIDQKQKEKWDYIYLVCFILLFIPLPFDRRVDVLNEGFRLKQFLPVTYGIIIQNIAALVMISCLIMESITKKKLYITKKFLEKSFLKLSNNIKRFDKFYWLIPVFIILVYNLTFFNKYVPITEGWFSAYAWLFNHGDFPYKDFYFFLTPLYLIKMSLFTSLFGYDIFYLRIFGIGVIILTTYFLYKNFEIISGKMTAAFIATIGMIYYQSGVAHITYDFTQFVTLYGVIQSYLILKYVKFRKKSVDNIKLIFLAGIFAGFAFLTKQSNGLMITFFSFAGLFLVTLPQGKKVMAKVLVSYICGLALPVITIFLWLQINSAFLQFKEQVFTGAVSAKGGLIQIFTGWIKEMLTYNFISRFLEILVVIGIFGYWKYFLKEKRKVDENFNVVLLLGALLAIFIIILLLFSNHIIIIRNLAKLGQIGLSNLTVAAVSVSIFMIAVALFQFLLKKPFSNVIALSSFVSIGFIFGTGTAAGLSEAGAFFGFCIFISLMLTHKSFLNLGKIFILFFCISLVINFIEIKYERPYYWWNATTPDIRGSLAATNKVKILRNMYSSPENIKLIEEVSNEIEKGSKPEDTVFTFPNIPIFYLITDRKPPGNAVVHWFDFLPDDQAVKEAEMIRKNPPKVIVYLDLGDPVWKAHENLFREGRSSGQREIVKAFMEIVKDKKMHVSKKYELPNDVALTVWKN